MPVNSYGGQFQGISARAGKTTETPTPLASGRRQSAAATSYEQAAAGIVDDPDAPLGEKVVIKFGKLRDVTGLEDLGKSGKRSILAIALFANEDLKQIINQTGRRTHPVSAKYMQGGKLLFAHLDTEMLVLPIKDPMQKLMLYVCIVNEKEEEENGKTFKSFSLVGIGFSEPLDVKTQKTLPNINLEMRVVEGGDPSIDPGSLGISLQVLPHDKGPNFPEDRKENVMEQFQK